MIVDSHSHIGSYREIGRESTPKSWVETMDKCGVDVSCISQLTKDMKSDNDAVHEGLKSYPKRLVGLAHIIPTSGEASVAEVKRTVEKLGFKGMKFHPMFDAFLPFDETIYKVYDAIEDAGVPILSHSGTYPYSLPLQIAYVAREYPKIAFILGHSGLVDSLYDSIPAAKLCDNIYLDTSGCPQHTVFEDAVRQIGANRVLWGVDFPYLDPIAQMSTIEAMNITAAEKALIMGENATRLYRIKT